MLNSHMQKMIFYFFNLNKNKGRRMSLKKLMNAGFKSILNLVFNQKAERKKMDHQKSKSTFSAILLTLTLMVAAFWVSPAAVAAEKKMVTDPSTGKMVTAPEYGGTITYALLADPASPDSFLSDHAALMIVGPVLEKLALGDWATPRDKWDFQYHTPPTNTRGALAESWSQPDPLTYVINLRQGVHWHNKAPMNGRELTADDIVYNYHRFTGTGSGFTEPSVNAIQWKGVQIESITATDDSTVVFRLKEPSLGALLPILDGHAYCTYPPEVIKEHGDAHDWRNLVGTGPTMLTDLTQGSSITWDKNPDYWAYDEKYPENRLPYIDRLRALVMPEVATQLAALRTAQVDYVGQLGQTQIKSLDQVDSLQKTNPELVITPYATISANAVGLNVQMKPV